MLCAGTLNAFFEEKKRTSLSDTAPLRSTFSIFIIVSVRLYVCSDTQIALDPECMYRPHCLFFLFVCLLISYMFWRPSSIVSESGSIVFKEMHVIRYCLCNVFSFKVINSLFVVLSEI